MQVDRTLKAGQTIPPLRVRLGFVDPDENLNTFINADTPVTFAMRNRVTPPVVVVDDKEAVVVAVGTGWVEVEYEWEDGETDLPGLYFGEFTFDVAGKALPAPTNNYIAVRVIPTL